MKNAFGGTRYDFSPPNIYSYLIKIILIVGFCPRLTLWEYVLWDFVCGDFVLWDFVLWDSVWIPEEWPQCQEPQPVLDKLKQHVFTLPCIQKLMMFQYIIHWESTYK